MTTWKPVPGLEGVEASFDGRIRKELKQTLKSDKYKTVWIQTGHASKSFIVSRLVAAAFHGMDIFDRSAFACHKDDNPSNCAADNIFVGTPQANIDDMIQKGRQVVWSKLTEENVIEIRKKRSAGFPINKLAKEFNVHKSTISRICNGITW